MLYIEEEGRDRKSLDWKGLEPLLEAVSHLDEGLEPLAMKIIRGQEKAAAAEKFHHYE